MYEMYLAGENNAYFSIDVFIGGSKIAVRRFFLEDTYTSKDYVNVLTSLKLSVFLNSTGYLNSPKLQLSYTKLTY